MSNNTTADVTGIFSLDANRLVGLAAKGSPDVTYLAGQDMPTSGIPLTATLSDGVVASYVGSDIVRSTPQAGYADARDALRGIADGYKESVISSSIARRYATIPGSVWFVSNAATNNFASGADANNGTSKLTPKLTLAAAVAAARDGDMIVLNDSATPYLVTNLDISKRLTIVPLSAGGATIAADTGSTSYVIKILIGTVTLGALIVDTNGNAPVAFSDDLLFRKLRLIGTTVKTHTTYWTQFQSELECVDGVQWISTGVTKAAIKLPCNVLSGTIYFGAGTVIDGNVDCRPEKLGVKFRMYGTTINGVPSGSASFGLYLGGLDDIEIIDSYYPGVDVASTAALNVVPIVGKPCSRVYIRNYRCNGPRNSGSAGGYGFIIGDDALTTTGAAISGVEITGCLVEHVNHGIILSVGVTDANIWGNVIRDSVIGLIAKATSGPVAFYSNVVAGGSLTGGALRTKQSNAVFYNNLVIYDAQSVSGGRFIWSSDSSANPAFKNNILYAPGLTVSCAVQIDAGSTASASNNDYFGSLAATAFAGGALAAWQASSEPTALSVDPQFAGGGDWRLLPTSPLANYGVLGLAPCDYYGNAWSGVPCGPMPVSA